MDASVLNENNRETTATVREAALEPVRLAEQRNAEEHGIDEQLGLAVGTNGELTRRSPEPRQTTPAESSRTHQEAAGAVDVIAAWSPLRADEWRIARDVKGWHLRSVASGQQFVDDRPLLRSARRCDTDVETLRMRIVALSDQHGFLPDVPPCDLLIVAGDLCPDRFGPFMAVHDPHQQQAWFDWKIRPWLAAAPATHKLLTWGNHDWCGQACSFLSDSPQHARSTDLQVLVDEGTTVTFSEGSGGQISVWGTPWSNRFMRWAFMKEPRDLEPIYAAIPGGTDIVVSHQPPHGYGDQTFNLDSGRVEHVGSRELLAAIERIRPRVVICGHVHGGFGRFEHRGIPIYNVSVVDERYRLVNAPTVIELPDV